MALRFADSASSNSARGGVGDIVGNEEDDEDEDEDEDDIIPTRESHTSLKRRNKWPSSLFLEGFRIENFWSFIWRVLLQISETLGFQLIFN